MHVAGVIHSLAVNRVIISLSRNKKKKNIENVPGAQDRSKTCLSSLGHKQRNLVLSFVPLVSSSPLPPLLCRQCDVLFMGIVSWSLDGGGSSGKEGGREVDVGGGIVVVVVVIVPFK